MAKAAAKTEVKQEYITPPKRITINGQEFRMYYGLLNELCRMIELEQDVVSGNTPRPDLMSLSSTGRDMILFTLLVDRDDLGEHVFPEGIDPENDDRFAHLVYMKTKDWEVSDIAKLLDWANRSLVDFFLTELIRSADGIMKEMIKPILGDLQAAAAEDKAQSQTEDQ